MNFVAEKSRLKYLLFSKVNNSYNRINTEKEMGEREIARKRRIWFPGATFHIMERGIRRQAIYEEEGDYQIFKAILEKCLEKYGCRLQAYCMMTNHFHLLLETSDVDVSKFMKQLANCYAIYFNKKYGYQGHLFEGRYKSCLVETDEYFLQTSRYIHLNPVKAKMVAHPEDYPWSSYRSILGLCDDRVSERDKTLKYFGTKGVFGYREFVEDIGHKYIIHEDEIKKSMGENELWLPW